jgi:hypothetical protein
MIIYYLGFHVSNAEKEIYKVSHFRSCVDHYYVSDALRKAPNSNPFTSRHLNYSAYMPDHVQTRERESVTSYYITLLI